MHFQYLKRAAGALLCAGALALAGCDSDSPASTTTTVGGTAATGAPIASATVNLRCSGGATATATTSATGKWSVTVPTASLPCAVQIDTGVVELYAFTIGSGGSIVANLSPLTSLAIAGATGAAPDDAWFDSLNDSGLQTLSIDLTAALTALANALQAQGYALPAGAFNPFTTGFEAITGNAWDDLLEALKAALDTAGSDLPTLLASYAGGGDLPLAPADGDCTAGDDKLVFTSNPADFCGFSKEASANTIDNYYQFTSSAGTHGTTYVKFTVDGDAVTSVTIENDDYAYACGTPFAACSGVTQTIGSSYRQFTLADTTLTAFADAAQTLTVNGLLIHQTGSSGDTGGSDTITTATLEPGELGVRFASNGTIQGTPESGVTRFWSGQGGITPGSGDSAGLIDEAYLVIGDPYSLLGLRYLPNTVGTYDCGYALGGLNPRNIELAYAVGQGYSSVGTRGVSGFSCSVTVTHVGAIVGGSYSGYVEGTFTARLFKTGAPVSLANSIVVSGTFRLGVIPS